MKSKTKIRARKIADGQTEILVMINHPMSRKPSTGSHGCVSGQFIQTLRFHRNDKLVAEAMLGPLVAENPLTAITLNDTKVGDRIRVRWTDNEGSTGQGQVIL